ncbi:MAG: hypothetical protein NTY90_03050 [Candidatus Micrarchaeota archaeon]|nr:hypothetical protein [Candidatus Micrarchaeota archaeon]
MVCIKCVSGPLVNTALLLLVAAFAYGAWVLTTPFLQPLGAVKYAAIPLYLLLGFFLILPIAASFFVFAAIFLTQFTALRHLVGAKIRGNAKLSKPKPIEYYEYDDESRDYVKRTGYFNDQSVG